ncbi:MAG: chalcone isomerase family protein [Aliidiomarina sp.]|uniref:chalcone isomerase family protein n=1 Tax=Aliidiomarina sp. TaxID=1872439 RepID=UPI0025BF8DE3|nr:chalcone isomerase family protein [Aliidiomarina sp.]MCH8500363.1 chalcone isomerase family protein [Aliidiomarina sp.]
MRYIRKVAVAVSLIVLACSASATAGQQCYSALLDQEHAPTSVLKPVGETRLRVLLMRIYDAALFTRSGEFNGMEPMVLAIEYARDISAQQLVNQTRDEWQRMDLFDENSEQWLEQLAKMWPNVSSGDCLIAARTEDGTTQFFSAEKSLGEIDAPEFAEKFFSIWLAENARFRRSRDELVGERG